MLSLFAADLAILKVRLFFLPERPQQSTSRMAPPNPIKSRDFFQPIVSRNLFSSKGEIPPEILPKGVEAKPKDNEPILSSLPLNLVGTLVHSLPEKSIAAIEIKSKNQISSFSTGKDIESLAKIEKITRGKVIIRNLSADRLEYIEMKDANKVTFDAKPKVANTADEKPSIIQKSGDNKFEIKKSDLDEKLKDIQSILYQARAVPAQRPGTGETYGFRLLEIQADSIYTQLGLQVMDVITSVNGTPVTSTQQALEMYQALRNSSQIKLGVERGGKNEELSYNVKQ
ncbi:MAG: PDZ domain-containing protein [Bdellovibrionaceae bacterium]|nr:PDZ domain-containing protein [Pseudobdellovibrionaceae bacterium]